MFVLVVFSIRSTSILTCCWRPTENDLRNSGFRDKTQMSNKTHTHTHTGVSPLSLEDHADCAFLQVKYQWRVPVFSAVRESSQHCSYY